jgi:hypothetical protein
LVRVGRILVVFLVLLALPAGRAAAASDQEAIFQDNRLLLNSPATLSQTLNTLKLLGVDRLVMGVNWVALAPDPLSRVPPAGFDGANPAAYLATKWTPFDRIVAQAAAFGMRVHFNVTGGAPLWGDKPAPGPSMVRVWYPSATGFGAFVHAVGERYSGHFTPPGASAPLPRVNYWSVWSEPNVGSSSLSPQTVNGIEVGPSLYRGLLDAAWSALLATGHHPGTDTILVGQMASTGHADPGLKLGMQPLRFLRALYCVDSSYRPLQGSAAAARGCPTTATASKQFPAQHPALFNATGWGHHPYYLNGGAPSQPSPAIDPDWVTFSGLPKLEGALDAVQRVHGSSRRLPIYITEYGIETNPPRPEYPISPALAATYLNEAEYLAWRDPRVRTMSQYLLQDAPGRTPTTLSSFATGLLFLDGTKKATFDAYRLPIWMPAVSASSGHPLEVWGDVRPAKRYPRAAPPVQIQLDGRTVRSAMPNPEGYFDVGVTFTHGGAVRLAWTYPGGGTIYSRAVAVTVTKGTSNPIGLVAAVGGVLILCALGGVAVARRRRRASG